MNPRLANAYHFLCCVFCVLLVVTNLVGTKLIHVPWSEYSAIPASIIIYPLTFLISDIVCEIYGQKQARWMVILGFITSLITMSYIYAIVHIPPHPSWATATSYGFQSADEWQLAFTKVFALNPITVLSSLLAFLCAQFVDVFLFDRIRKATQGKHLWLRNNLSTMVSQSVDTFIGVSIVIFFTMQLPLIQTIQIGVVLYFFKVIIALVDTPLCYLGVFLLNKWKQSDRAPDLGNPEPIAAEYEDE